jgi:bacteriocin resistance YdeI/OmpD-like protein
MSEALREKEIPGGLVHHLPADLKKALASDAKALETWKDITPLARNEWICWIESAKKAETRTHRIEWGCSSLKDGKRRPCCWPSASLRSSRSSLRPAKPPPLAFRSPTVA